MEFSQFVTVISRGVIAFNYFTYRDVIVSIPCPAIAQPIKASISTTIEHC
jgi:hypothetical protein